MASFLADWSSFFVGTLVTVKSMTASFSGNGNSRAARICTIDAISPASLRGGNNSSFSTASPRRAAMTTVPGEMCSDLSCRAIHSPTFWELARSNSSPGTGITSTRLTRVLPGVLPVATCTTRNIRWSMSSAVTSLLRPNPERAQISALGQARPLVIGVSAIVCHSHFLPGGKRIRNTQLGQVPEI